MISLTQIRANECRYQDLLAVPRDRFGQRDAEGRPGGSPDDQRWSRP